MLIAIRAEDGDALHAAFEAAEAALAGPSGGGGRREGWNPRSLETALRALPSANLAIVSVPGEFAAREARRALERGLNVMLFSDNVPVEDEIALKALARERGLLMMGPDCGTAIVAGAPIGFANAVPRGDIGLIAASGTGLQEVACLIARAGGGISHGIGVGGRDLGAAVGGAMTLTAIDALDRDPATRRIVLISKPPDPATAGRIAERIAGSASVSPSASSAWEKWICRRTRDRRRRCARRPRTRWPGRALRSRRARCGKPGAATAARAARSAASTAAGRSAPRRRRC